MSDNLERVAREAKRKTTQTRRRAKKTYDRHGTIFHLLWLVASVTVLIAGLAMTLFPGPAVVVIPLGLAMLSVEFAWASRFVDTALDKSIEAAEKIDRLDRKKKLLGIAAAVLLVGAAIALYLLL